VAETPSPAPRFAPAFWYRVIDTIHYAQLSLPKYIDGCATIQRREWTLLHYRVSSPTASRAFERFKENARACGIAQELSVTHDDGREIGPATGYFHIDIARAYEQAQQVLPPPEEPQTKRRPKKSGRRRKK
jgi:hypothetical protein